MAGGLRNIMREWMATFPSQVSRRPTKFVLESDTAGWNMEVFLAGHSKLGLVDQTFQTGTNT